MPRPPIRNGFTASVFSNEASVYVCDKTESVALCARTWRFLKEADRNYRVESFRYQEFLILRQAAGLAIFLKNSIARF